MSSFEIKPGGVHLDGKRTGLDQSATCVAILRNSLNVHAWRFTFKQKAEISAASVRTRRNYEAALTAI